MFRRTCACLALAVAGGLLAAVAGPAPTAHAATSPGTLVYIKGGNIWAAKPDGSGQRQITRDGGYADPSMADNGRIAALRHDDVVILRPDGSRVAQWDPGSLFGPDDCATLVETPPAELVISPDGAKVAWSQIRSSNCAGNLRFLSVTAISDATRNTHRGLVEGYDPGWVGNGRIVVDNRGTMTLAPVDGADPEGYAWFNEYDLWEDDPNDPFDFLPSMESPAVSRDGRRVAYLFRTDPEHAVDHPTTDNPVTSSAPRVPSKSGVCSAVADTPTPDDGWVLEDLMFSPDGNALVDVESGNVWTITGIETGGCAQREFRRVLTGVSDVHWSGYTGRVGAVRDTAAPSLRVTKVAVKKRTATVIFRASDNATPVSGLRFQCQVDRARKSACSSPKRFARLKPGRHTVKVWATDRAGNTRSTSARFRVRR